MGIIIFNGVSSADFNILIEHPPGYEMPKKDYEVTHIPGRNGDVYIDKGSYQNTTRSYDIAVGDSDRSFISMANMVSEWLHSASGYSRLEDSYEPEYYRMAVYKEENNIQNILDHAGRATIQFDCKPQRFLKLGDIEIYATSEIVLRNPTGFSAKPIIKINGRGSGWLNVGNQSVNITEINEYVTMDCELQDAYKGVQNCNSKIELVDGIFPKLDAGETTINFNGGITSVEVIPRWWTL